MKKIQFILLVLMLITTTTAHPLMTAISYDPPGSDGGYEWVELFNPSNESLILTNYSLSKGNGANEDDWTLVWSNSSFEMQPLTFYTIGEQEVVAADEIAKLGLQNGPDAIRLLHNNNTIETIGWGNHQFAEYYDDEPTGDVASAVLVRNFTIVEHDVLFTQTQNNNRDFYFETDRAPHTQFFSLSQLLLPTDSTSDVTYVLTIPNQIPHMSGAELLVVDVSDQSGHQVVVPESSLLPLRVFVSDGNGIDDITTMHYELQLDGTSFMSESVTTFQNVTNQSLDVEIPFLSSYPAGKYTILLTAEDSQNAKSQTAGLQFETQFVLGVTVLDDVLVFEANEGAKNFTTNVTLENTGNIDSRLDFLLQSALDVKVTYALAQTALGENGIPLLRPGENVTVRVTVTPRAKLKAGRYTGLFRVVSYEATV